MPLHNNDLGIQYQWNSSLTEWGMRNAVQQMPRRRKTNKKITPMVSVYLRTNITVLVVYVVYCQCSECIVSEERSIDRWSSSTSSSILPGNISSLAGTLLSIAVSRTYLVANEIQKKYTLHPQPHKDLWALSVVFMMVPFCTVYTYCGHYWTTSAPLIDGRFTGREFLINFVHLWWCSPVSVHCN